MKSTSSPPEAAARPAFSTDALALVLAALIAVAVVAGLLPTVAW
jgi:hypothetical protein